MAGIAGKLCIRPFFLYYVISELVAVVIYHPSIHPFITLPALYPVVSYSQSTISERLQRLPVLLQNRECIVMNITCVWFQQYCNNRASLLPLFAVRHCRCRHSTWFVWLIWEGSVETLEWRQMSFNKHACVGLLKTLVFMLHWHRIKSPVPLRIVIHMIAFMRQNMNTVNAETDFPGH